jgi:hypothetical protein
VDEKSKIFAFQRRWLTPAGVSSILAAALIVVSGVLTRAGLSTPSNNADQLELYQHHSARLLDAQIVTSVGLALLAIPLYFLYRSALLRAEKMRGFLLPLVIIGPLLLGVQGVFLSVGLKDASDTYTTKLPAAQASARQGAESAQKRQQTGSAKAATTTVATTTAATTTTSNASTGRTTPTTNQAAPPPGQAAANARKDLANDTINDTTAIKVSNALGFLGALIMLAGSIYALVWVRRTGLLTRSWAVIGIAVIVALFVIPAVGPIGIVLWFAITGLMLARLWPRPLPPAWEAGEAIPWPRPGEDLGPPMAERGESSTVEGSGREISEPPLPEGTQNGEPDQPPEPPYGETQGQRRKKRKRRR